MSRLQRFGSAPQSALYSNPEGALFVPSEDMWLLHQASKPEAVCRRAKLDPKAWDEWKRTYGASNPQLFDWLYDQKSKWEGDAGFKPNAAMIGFREQATYEKIAAAAQRSPEQVASARKRQYGSHVSAELIHYFLNRHKSYPWVARWLLRGEEVPRGVTVVTVDQARRCRAAWDYGAHCSAAGLDPHAYTTWLKENLIPEVNRLPWLRWLFGDKQPRGVFIVGGLLQKLRAETTQDGICAGAKVGVTSLKRWEASPTLTSLLQQAIQIAAGPGGHKDKLPVFLANATLDPRNKRTMWKYARAATLAARCDRAGMKNTSTYHNFLRDAKKLGVEQELHDYLGRKGRYGRTKSRQSGLVVEKFFSNRSPGFDTHVHYVYRVGG